MNAKTDTGGAINRAGIGHVILAGMSANLCTASHMRELLEQGFELAVVADATAAAKLPGYDGYEAAFVNFRFTASDVWGTEEAVMQMEEAMQSSVPARAAS